MMDFDTVVRQIQQHRVANPRFAQKWATDIESIGNELDLFTCIRIANNPNYCTGGSPPKAARPPLGLRVAGSRSGGIVQRAAAVVERVAVKAKKYYSGVGVLLSWVGSGGKVVTQEQAEARAKVCSECPKNQPGDLDSIFTAIAAEKIRAHLALKNEMDLHTGYDDKLHVCQACLCVCSLKVWVPIGHVLERLKPEMKDELHESCWILKESA